MKRKKQKIRYLLIGLGGLFILSVGMLFGLMVSSGSIVTKYITSKMGFILNIEKDPEFLDAPLLKGLNEKHGSSLRLAGIAYPNAKILLYIDEQYADDISVDENGTFSKTINFDNDGIKKIKIKQTYKNITSEFGNEFSVEIDITPPNSELFNLNNKFPEISKEKSILITGSGSSSDFIVLNNKRYKINDDGSFEINLELQEGNNNLEFSMTDQVGNNTETLDKHIILIDSIPPVISNFIAPLKREPTEESVLVSMGSWQGYLDSVNSVAITGSIQGNIKSLTIDGKTISWDENNNIYQRLNLFIYGGLNKYKVIAEDMAGNVSTGYVQTTAERNDNELNVNLND